jgi:hypothetical protein
MLEINPEKLVLIVIGLIVSIITYFIKRESAKLDRLGQDVRKIDKELTNNSCQDKERWYWINKNLEDRREDVRKLYDLISKLKDK